MRTTKGNFAHVTGTFDLDDRTGSIDYVTPVRAATETAELKDEGIHLIGEDSAKKRLFEKVVQPQRNSCAPHARKGTFEEFVPVSPQLQTIRLTVLGETAATFARGHQVLPIAVSLGAADPATPHKMPLQTLSKVGVSGVTYTVQAAPNGTEHWQTLGVGLPTPAINVDVNQFPGSKSVSVRVLQSDGFSETEVFRDTKAF